MSVVKFATSNSNDLNGNLNVKVQSDWNTVDESLDSFIKNKPTSLPANGGNADTVDGKHATDFAPSGYGLGGASQAVTGDWNDYIKTGFYYGSNMLNQPPTPAGTNTTWFVISIKFGDDRWCTQVAFNAQTINFNYIRKKVNNTWNQWIKINDNGNADTVDGKHITDLIQKNGVIHNAIANNIRTSGEYYIQEGTGFPENPIGRCYGWLKVEEGYNANYVKQTYSNINGIPFLYQRFLVNNIWNDWIKIGGNNSEIVNRNLLASSFNSGGFNKILENTHCGFGLILNKTLKSKSLFTGLKLKINQYYTVSFVAWTSGGNQGMIFDLYPDTLPEKIFKITNIPKIYTFTCISNSSDMLNCALRFFTVQHTYVADVYITDIKLEEGQDRTSYSLPPEDMYKTGTVKTLNASFISNNDISNDEILMIYE